MGVGKKHPAFGQRVNIRCLYLRMALETSHPVIQVVDGYKEYIGLGRLNGYGEEKNYSKDILHVKRGLNYAMISFTT